MVKLESVPKSVRKMNISTDGYGLFASNTWFSYHKVRHWTKEKVDLPINILNETRRLLVWSPSISS